MVFDQAEATLYLKIRQTISHSITSNKHWKQNSTALLLINIVSERDKIKSGQVRSAEEP